MSLPTNNGAFIHKGYNCSAMIIPSGQSIPLTPTDSTTLYNAIISKQNITDNTLSTTDKTIVGAINELYSNKVNTSDLATVAFSGSYNDLSNTPNVAEIDDSSTASNKAWSASKIGTDLGGKVDKSGDTMTGGLWMNNTDVYVKDTDMSTTTPSSNMYGNGLYIKDTNSTDIGYLRAIHQTNGNYGLQLEAHRVVNNTNYYNTVLLGVDSSGNKLVGVSDPKQWRNALGLAAVAESGSYNDLSNKPTIPDISGKVDKTGDPTVFKTSDIPQGAANLGASATAHRVTVYRNGLSIPYQMDNTNDGGILRVRGTSESNCILELGTWDDSGSGETIQFNYYPTTSQITPTYSVSVPKASGTIALTSQLPSTYEQSYTRNHSSVSYTEHLRCWRYGNVVTLGGYFSCNGSIATNTLLYTLPSPKFVIYFTAKHETANRMYNFNLQTNGQLKTNEAIAGGNYLVCFTYVCA